MEKRILQPATHVKAHSARGPSRKGAFCATAHMQSASLRESETPRVRLYVSRRLQSGALVYAAATRFAEASTHTNPRRATYSDFVVALLMRPYILAHQLRFD